MYGRAVTLTILRLRRWGRPSKRWLRQQASFRKVTRSPMECHPRAGQGRMIRSQKTTSQRARTTRQTKPPQAAKAGNEVLESSEDDANAYLQGGETSGGPDIISARRMSSKEPASSFLRVARACDRMAAWKALCLPPQFRWGM
jgi:hypothetical protein